MCAYILGRTLARIRHGMRDVLAITFVVRKGTKQVSLHLSLLSYINNPNQIAIPLAASLDMIIGTYETLKLLQCK